MKIASLSRKAKSSSTQIYFTVLINKLIVLSLFLRACGGSL